MYKDWGVELENEGKVVFPPSFKVRMGSATYKKLFSYVLASHLEVSGLGLVRQANGGFEIYDVFVLEQVSSGGHTDLNEKAMTDLMIRIKRGGGNVNDLRLWWHTHPKFGTFWSGTDEATCERLLNERYVMAWCLNHYYDIKCRIDLTKPFRMTLDDVPIEVEGRESRKTVKSFSREAKGKVKPYVFKSRGNRGYETLYVNPRLKRSSYKKDEVSPTICYSCQAVDCQGCKVFKKMMEGQDEKIPSKQGLV